MYFPVPGHGSSSKMSLRTSTEQDLRWLHLQSSRIREHRPTSEFLSCGITLSENQLNSRARWYFDLLSIEQFKRYFNTHVTQTDIILHVFVWMEILINDILLYTFVIAIVYRETVFYRVGKFWKIIIIIMSIKLMSIDSLSCLAIMQKSRNWALLNSSTKIC